MGVVGTLSLLVCVVGTKVPVPTRAFLGPLEGEETLEKRVWAGTSPCTLHGVRA